MKSFVLLCLCLLMSACSSVQFENSEEIRHVVMVWMKKKPTESEFNELLKASLALKEIKQLLSIQGGRAISSERPIVDDSFDLGLVMTFRNIKEMDEYVNHPIHEAFVNKYIKGRVDKVVVYDF